MKDKIFQYIKNNRIAFSILLDLIGFITILIIGSFVVQSIGFENMPTDELFIKGAMFGVVCYEFIYFLVSLVIDIIRFFVNYLKNKKEV